MIRSDLAIMVVDNEPIVRLGITVMLREAGLCCRAVDGYAAAFAVVDGGFEPDLLISDQNMPDHTGVELGSALSARFPRLHVLLVSGDENVADELPAGWHILAKPFTSIELQEKLTEIFSQTSQPTLAS